MNEYVVRFGVQVSVKNKKDLYRKAEKIAQQMTMCVGKSVYPLDYGELKTKKVISDDNLQSKE